MTVLEVRVSYLRRYISRVAPFFFICRVAKWLTFYVVTFQFHVPTKKPWFSLNISHYWQRRYMTFLKINICIWHIICWCSYKTPPVFSFNVGRMTSSSESRVLLSFSIFQGNCLQIYVDRLTSDINTVCLTVLLNLQYYFKRVSVNPLYQLLNDLTNLHETCYISHVAWANLSGVLHKSLPCLLSVLGNGSVNTFQPQWINAAT
jgi:hypothetical protein